MLERPDRSNFEEENFHPIHLCWSRLAEEIAFWQAKPLS